jgi:hypothetical protein
MHNNPFLRGKEDALQGKENSNPYSNSNSELGKFAAYNKSFNMHNPKTAQYFNQQRKQEN